jgi:hypothetical protein
MAEAWRKEEDPLTTADLAGTRTRFNAETPTSGAVRDDRDNREDLASQPASRRGSLPESSDDAPAGTESPAPDGGPRLVRNEQRDGISNPAAGNTPLLADAELTDLRSRWTDIQAGFVDEPRQSVERADQLVASAIQRLAEAFARERAALESQWESGSNVSTEDLRLALQRYRSFFGRLLNAA